MEIMHPWLFYFMAAIVALIIIVVSSDSHDPFRFHARFILYYVFSSTVAVISMPYIALKPRDVKNCLDMSWYLKQVTKILGIQWELRGREDLGVERGCVIVANHQSTLDILGMFNIWEVMGKCAAVARKEVFYVWPFGLAAWLAGVVFIDRRNRHRAAITLRETSELMKTKKTKMWIFPEGTRNKTVLERGLLPFKKGAFIVAIENQVPILPIVFSPYYFINEKTSYFGKGKVIVQALKPISTEGLELKDIDDLMKRTYDVMNETLEELAKEVLAPLPPNYPGLRRPDTTKAKIS